MISERTPGLAGAGVSMSTAGSRGAGGRILDEFVQAG
jgi:hypothetical protein